MATLGLAIAAVALLLSLAVAYYAMKRAARLGLVQEPTERSSHTRPTPLGGGLGVVAGGSFAGLLAAMLIPWLAVPVLMAGILIALIGFSDDRRPIAARWRLGAQVLLTGAVVATLPLDALGPQLGLAVPESVLLVVLALSGALWINVFNFMDGIDGLAGTEAIFLLVGGALLAWLAEPLVLEDLRLWWMLGIAAATLGFLLLNWAPARIFMGDTGSTYLGLMIAFFGFSTIASAWLSVWQWLILGALFLADSLTTLARRALNREPVWEAHRRHAYQALQRRFRSHSRVTLLALAMNVLVLLPLSWLAGQLPQWGWLIAFVTYAVLVPAAIRAGAGAPERESSPLRRE